MDVCISGSFVTFVDIIVVYFCSALQSCLHIWNRILLVIHILKEFKEGISQMH